jgi:hypothetical protein
MTYDNYEMYAKPNWTTLPGTTALGGKLVAQMSGSR